MVGLTHMSFVAWGMSRRCPRKSPEWWSVLKHRIATTFGTTSYANAVVYADSERSMVTVRRRKALFDVRGFRVSCTGKKISPAEEERVWEDVRGMGYSVGHGKDWVVRLEDDLKMVGIEVDG